MSERDSLLLNFNVNVQIRDETWPVEKASVGRHKRIFSVPYCVIQHGERVTASRQFLESL